MGRLEQKKWTKAEPLLFVTTVGDLKSGREDLNFRPHGPEAWGPPLSENLKAYNCHYLTKQKAFEFGKRVVLELMSTSARSFTTGSAPKERTLCAFVRFGDFLVCGSHHTTSNLVLWARWPRPAAVLRTGSRAANEKGRQGRTRRPAHTLPDTRSTTVAGSDSTTSASPARTASGPTTGHSTMPANPRSSCDRPPARATSAPRCCCPSGSPDARRTTSVQASVPAGSTGFCVALGVVVVPPLPLPSGAGKRPRPCASLGPVARRLRCLHAPPTGGH